MKFRNISKAGYALSIPPGVAAAFFLFWSLFCFYGGADGNTGSAESLLAGTLFLLLSLLAAKIFLLLQKSRRTAYLTLGCAFETIIGVWWLVWWFPALADFSRFVDTGHCLLQGILLLILAVIGCAIYRSR